MGGEDVKGITVCVRVRPLNQRELDDGNRICTGYDSVTKQVALTAVDKNTLLQLKGATARGYAFDKYFGMDETSDTIFKECVDGLVQNIFKGYNGTVLAYGQTGSGKTHTMSGGVGHYGVKEPGITPRVIQHIFAHVANIKRTLKPGESVQISATAVELYNDKFNDLSKKKVAKDSGSGWERSRHSNGAELKLNEYKTGHGNRMRAEITGLHEELCDEEQELVDFFAVCFGNRTTSSTDLNDASSRSHAIFTINVRRVIVTVGDGVDKNLRAKVRTEGVESKLHLVDLAGSERVKRSGVEGKQFKEATMINSGLLALGNVIVALAENNSHIPYRDSKLTRLIQDSLGGNSLTCLITCISPSESDFEETNNTLKYANRACSIQNQPLPNKFLMMEEDLLPVAPGINTSGNGVVSIEALLEENLKQKELRERKKKEKEEKDKARREALSLHKEKLMKTMGFQRLLAQEYDRKLKEARMRGKKKFDVNETVDGIKVVNPDNLGSGYGSAPLHSNGSTSNGRIPANVNSVQSAPAGSFDLHNLLKSPSDTSVDVNTSDLPSPATHSADTPPPKNLSPSLARVLARRQKNAAQQAGRTDASPASSGPSATIPPATSPAPHLQEQQSSMSEPHTPDLLDHATDEEEPLAAEVEAHLREEAELEALRKVKIMELDGRPHMDDDLNKIEEGDSETTGVDDTDGEEEAGIRVLARFRVNKQDAVSVFKATTKEDFKDVVKLLPANTPLPASNKMTYLIARLELNPAASIHDRIENVRDGNASMGDAVGPAVGCLMATFGTNMISSCIFDFDDPMELEEFAVEERIELWGLQIPHNSMRPVLHDIDPAALAVETEGAEETTVAWSSVDRLNMSVGLLYALCVNANSANVRCGFCVPRSQLLRRWQGAGVRMKEVKTMMKLIYPPHAHDFEYYKSSTVAYFLVDEVQNGLQRKLALLDQPEE